MCFLLMTLVHVQKLRVIIYFISGIFSRISLYDNTTITRICMAIRFKLDFRIMSLRCLCSVATHSQDVFAPGHSFRSLNWTGCHRTPYVTSIYSTGIFYRGVSGFATDFPCGVWCRGLITCLLYVGPLFGNHLFNYSWVVGLI